MAMALAVAVNTYFGCVHAQNGSRYYASFHFALVAFLFAAMAGR